MNIRYFTEYGIFEWDRNKETINLKKHGIAFIDAIYAFADEKNVLFYDPIHSVNEDRYILLGRIKKEKVISLVFTEREEVCRIISARMAERWEKEIYERNVHLPH